MGGGTLTIPEQCVVVWATRLGARYSFGPVHIQDLPSVLAQLTEGYSNIDQVAFNCSDPTPPDPNPIPPPAPPPPPSAPPELPPGGGGGDEISIIITLLEQIIVKCCGSNAIPPTGQSPDCCKQVTVAISSITLTLIQILTAIKTIGAGGGPPPAPIDLSSIVTQLADLVAAVKSDEACCKLIVGSLDNGLGNIANAITNQPPTDTAGIVDQLKNIVFQGDVDQPTLNALAAAGFLSSSDLQVLQGAPWSKVLSWIESTKAWRLIEKGINTAGGDASALPSWIGEHAPPAGNWLEAKFKAALTIERNAIQDVISPILAAVKSALRPPQPTTIGVINVHPDQVLADVAAVGFNLQIMEALIGLVFPGVAESAEKITETATGLLGFEELREVQLGPLVRYGIARVAEMQARATFKQEIPGTPALQSLVAMGLLGRERERALAQFNGTPDELEPLLQQAAYRGLNPRQMLRLIETNLFSDAEIADELTFAAMRPTSQHRMLVAAPYLASQSQRNSLRSTLETAYAAGLLSDQDLAQRLESAETDTDRNSLSVSRARLQKLIAETKGLEAEYTTLVQGGLMTDAAYRANLAGLGIQPDMVNIIAGKAEARANALLQRKTLAAEAKLENETEAKLRQAAVQNFRNGIIDATGLVAALIATGLTAVQAAAWADLAVLRLEGSQRWLYGLLKSPQEAAVLRARVTALSDQRKRNLIPDNTFVDALTALGLPPREINALRAAADAMLTPKSSATVVPVQTT
jgi:hypothetical protein